MATIYIKDLVIEAKHGVHKHEKKHPQLFKVNVELQVNISQASQSDELEDTIDWSRTRDIIVQTVQSNTFNLIEKLVQEVADQLLKNQKIQKVAVSIDKLDAFETGVPGIRLEASQH